MKRFSYLPQRLLVLLIGVAVTEFGSQLFVALNVGADPFMILVQGISRQTGLSYGQASTILMLICLLGIFLFDKKNIFIQVHSFAFSALGHWWTFMPICSAAFCHRIAPSPSPSFF